MGYYMDQKSTKFNMKKDNISKAWDSLKELFNLEKKPIHDSAGYHFSWIDTDSVLNAESFNKAMDECRWTPYEDGEGNINWISFNGEKLGDDELIFSIIAPYVEDGSYIVMMGEDGTIWRWYFKGGTVREDYGRIVFDEDDE